MTNRLSFLLFIIGLFTLTANAQSTNPQNLGILSLEQCIQIAQEQSPVAESARYALISSKWQYQSFRADLLPSLSWSGDAPNFNRTLREDLTGGVIQYYDVRQSNASAALSVNQNILYTGGTLSLTSGLTRLGIFEGEDRYLWRSTPLQVGFRQPIFQFNNLKWQNRLQPLQYEIAQKEYIQEMENIAGRVTRQFFDVYLAKINLENAQFNVAKNDSIYQISIGRYNVGSIAENDLLQSELQLRNSEAALTRARIEYERTLNNFKILLGYPTSVQMELDAPEELPNITVDIQRARELALQNNNEALNYQLQELQADRNYAQAKAQSNFSATLQANVGLNQTAENFNDVYAQPLDQQFITLGFDVPIFNWGKQRAQINAARNQQRSVANNIDFQRRQFIQEVDYTVGQFLQLRGQVILASKADTIAQRRYDSAQNRYLIGKISITDLFIAQQDRDSARQSYIQALREFWTGLYNLRELTLYDFRKNQPISHEL